MQADGPVIGGLRASKSMGECLDESFVLVI